MRFIRAHKDERFFLYLAHNAVHFPLYPGERFRGKSANGLYGDWVEEMDWSVGEVLDALRTQGLAEKTLVIFTSDNGGTPRAVNRPLRGNKGSTWEGGMRVPTIAWWPGKIPAGTSSDAICGMFDILPTFAALAGAAVPGDRKTRRRGHPFRPHWRCRRTGTPRGLLLLPGPRIGGGSRQGMEARAARRWPAAKAKAKAKGGAQRQVQPVCSISRRTSAKAPMSPHSIRKSSHAWRSSWRR